MGANIVMRLIGLITTVLVLGAVYLFIVKPVLDTTNNAFDTVNNSFEEFGLDDVDFSDLQSGDFSSIQNQIQDQIKGSGLNSGQRRNAERLLRCVQRVQPNTTKMAACADRFG